MSRSDSEICNYFIRGSSARSLLSRLHFALSLLSFSRSFLSCRGRFLSSRVMMADPVIRAALKLPAAAAVVAAIVDRLGRCRDSITLGVTFFSNALYRDACEYGGTRTRCPGDRSILRPRREIQIPSERLFRAKSSLSILIF